MRVFTIFGALMAMLAMGALADMDAREYRFVMDGTNIMSKSYTLHGNLEAVHVVPSTVSDTGKVEVTSGPLKVFDKSNIIAESFFMPRFGAQNYDGSAATNSLDRAAMAGTVKVKLTTTSKGTNRVWTVRLLYRR